jgi:hypothetical protein
MQVELTATDIPPPLNTPEPVYEIDAASAETAIIPKIVTVSATPWRRFDIIVVLITIFLRSASLLRSIKLGGRKMAPAI